MKKLILSTLVIIAFVSYVIYQKTNQPGSQTAPAYVPQITPLVSQTTGQGFKKYI